MLAVMLASHLPPEPRKLDRRVTTGSEGTLGAQKGSLF